MQAAILAIGDELVLGQTVDTNSAYLSAELTKLGVIPRYIQVVADDQADITEAIRRASTSADLVIVTGGLGPTADDLTRQALADVMGVSLITHEPSARLLRQFFARRGLAMPERNLIQSMHPDGTTMIHNPRGTAPGIKAALGNCTVYVTPGVPSEMVGMWEESIRPEIAARSTGGQTILTTTINTFGLGESHLAEKLGSLMDRARNPTVGTTVSGGIVSARVRSRFPTVEDAQRHLEDTVGKVEAALAPYVFSRGDETIQQTLVGMLKVREKTLATAESCTGGLLGKMITDVAGSSAVYLGGWITYANTMKTRELGVPVETLDRHGAVSKETAEAMAAGVIKKSGADLAVAITGIAGPDGGTTDKPVGTIYVALAAAHLHAGLHLETMRLSLVGDREIIRDRSAKCAAQMIRFNLLGVPLSLILWGKQA